MDELEWFAKHVFGYRSSAPFGDVGREFIVDSRRE
jgi:hypothetical protein